MKTLREFLEENKDKFVNGKLKIRCNRWEVGEWFEVCGMSEKDAVGFIKGDYSAHFSMASCYDATGGGAWELYQEPKPTKKLYPFVCRERNSIHKNTITYWLPKLDDGFSVPPGIDVVGPVPGGIPIEVEDV